MIALMAFTACEKELMTEEQPAKSKKTNSSLTITTRAGAEDGIVSYPVNIYVINPAGSCVKHVVLTSADDAFALGLEPQQYDIYAIGGATESAYELPTEGNVSKTSEITLKSGAQHGDLMTAKNTIEIEENEAASVVLTMSRKVLKVKSIVMQNIPDDVSSVVVSMGPLHDALLLEGSYKSGNKMQSFTLEKQDDGTTWKNDNALFLLPANGAATVTVKLTNGEGTKSISYTSPTPLEANHEIEILGTYVSSSLQFITLNGTITGATWGNPININFTFDENGQTSTNNSGGNDNGNNESGNNGQTGDAPSAKTWYKDCFVVSVADDDTGNNTLVTLIHKDEVEIDASSMTEEQLQSNINAALPGFDINGISGWRLPTEAELRALSVGQLNYDINTLGHDGTPITEYYFLQGTEHIQVWRGASSSNYSLGYTYGKRLRPVVTVQFSK